MSVRMHVVISLIAVAGCSRPVPEPQHHGTTATPTDAAGTSIGEAGTSIGEAPVDAMPDAAAIDAEPAHAFVPPEPMTIGEATPAGKKCRKAGAEDAAREYARETAALDIELRKQGSMLLPVEQSHSGQEAGTIVFGPQGRRMLVVAIVQSCGRPKLQFALASNGDVFRVLPTLRARKTRTVSVCEPICAASCGMPSPRTALLVEVPAGARLVAGRNITVPIDLKVDLVAPAAKSKDACKKRP